MTKSAKEDKLYKYKFLGFTLNKTCVICEPVMLMQKAIIDAQNRCRSTVIFKPVRNKTTLSTEVNIWITVAKSPLGMNISSSTKS